MTNLARLVLDHTVVITGITVTAWANMFISRITGAHDGSIFKAVVIDEATASLASATTAAVAWVESAT